MSSITKIAYFLVLPAMLFVGCKEPPVYAKFQMPAQKVVDVPAVNVVKIVAHGKVTGDMTAESDSAAAGGFIREAMSMRLYQEGFYTSVDSVWGSDEPSQIIAKSMEGLNSKHGYSRYVSQGKQAKSVLDITYGFRLNAAKNKHTEEFVLETVPYTVKQSGSDKPASSFPNYAAITRVTERREVECYDIDALGAIKATLTSVATGAVIYEKTFKLTLPGATGRRDVPSVPLAIAEMAMPAINEILVDISPHMEEVELHVNEDGDEKAVILLKSCAFADAVERIESLDSDDMEPADYENLGIAYEALGELSMAKDAYAKAVELEPDNENASKGVNRITNIIAGRDALRKAGVKLNEDTSFKRK